MEKELGSSSYVADEILLSLSSNKGDLILSVLVFNQYGVKSKRKLRFPYSKVKLMKLRIRRKDLEESSSNSSASCYEGSLSFYFFLQGLQFGNAFRYHLAGFMVKYASFCLHLSV